MKTANFRMHPAPTQPRSRMDRETRRRQLLDCAIKAFAERGTARAGHADIARLAQVSVATAFEYFPTRELLLDAVLVDTERFLFEVMACGTAAGSARGRVLEIFHVFANCVEDQPHHMRVWLDWSTSIREHVWPQYVAVQERIIEMFRQMIDEGRSAGTVHAVVVPEDAARILVGQAHMIAMMRFAHVEAERVSRFIDHMIDSALSR